MRIIKTDRGYFDAEHILHVGEPYEFQQGMWGFDVTLAFKDSAKRMLYYPEDLGVEREPYAEFSVKEKWKDDMQVAMLKKRDEFVEMWKAAT